MNVNRRLFNQYFIRQDEVYTHKKKVESINERILSLSKLLSAHGLKTHRNIFVAITDWIGVHENPTADSEKNRRWVNLPSQELVDYLNRLKQLSLLIIFHPPNHILFADEISDIIMKLEEPPF